MKPIHIDVHIWLGLPLIILRLILEFCIFFAANSFILSTWWCGVMNTSIISCIHIKFILKKKWFDFLCWIGRHSSFSLSLLVAVYIWIYHFYIKIVKMMSERHPICHYPTQISACCLFLLSTSHIDIVLTFLFLFLFSFSSSYSCSSFLFTR